MSCRLDIQLNAIIEVFFFFFIAKATEKVQTGWEFARRYRLLTVKAI